MSFENWTIEDLIARCTDFDEMTLEMDREEFAAHLRANYNGASVCKIIALGADDFAKQLREGTDK